MCVIFPFLILILFAFLTFNILHDLKFAFMVIRVCELRALTVVNKKPNFLYRIDWGKSLQVGNEELWPELFTEQSAVFQGVINKMFSLLHDNTAC